jgi:hypothetical protein
MRKKHLNASVTKILIISTKKKFKFGIEKYYYFNKSNLMKNIRKIIRQAIIERNPRKNTWEYNLVS